MTRFLRRGTPFLALLIFVLAWGFFLSVVSPTEIVEKVGVHNGYIIVFLVAAIAGVSAFTSTSSYIVLATFAVGGLHPVLLGIFAGIGVTIGDSIFFFLGVKGRHAARGKLKTAIERFSSWIHDRPRWVMPIATYIYCGFTFLPTDILSVALALARFRLRDAILWILLGNITLGMLIALIAVTYPELLTFSS